MSFMVKAERCIGCGACEYSCHAGALTKTDSFLGLFEIDPFTCDDCAVCVDKCPESAIVPDPAFPVCHGRGCPLTSTRLGDVECTIWQQRCPSCGSTMWLEPGASKPTCSVCDSGRKVSCPKTRLLPVHSS